MAFLMQNSYSLIYKFIGGTFSSSDCFISVICCRCFMNQSRADESPFLLYGVKDLAIPVRIMAMGRIGNMVTVYQE